MMLVGNEQVRQFMMDLQTGFTSEPSDTQHLLLKVSVGLMRLKDLPVSASNDLSF